MSFQTINPATGDTLRTFPMATDEEVATALKTPDGRYNNDWKHRPIAARAQIVKRAAALLRQNAGEYAGYLTLEQKRGFYKQVVDAESRSIATRPVVSRQCGFALSR